MVAERISSETYTGFFAGVTAVEVAAVAILRASIVTFIGHIGVTVAVLRTSIVTFIGALGVTSHGDRRHARIRDDEDERGVAATKSTCGYTSGYPSRNIVPANDQDDVVG